MRVVRMIAMVVLAMSAGASAQTTANPPAFEVASVKRVAPDGLSISGSLNGDTFRAGNITLRQLLTNFAYYDHLPSEIVGGPDWIDSDRFAIVAKIGGGGGLSAKMRTLLAERFKLRLHEEQRVVPVYDLVLAREDGRLGPRLVKADTPCAVNGSPGRRCNFAPRTGSFVATGMSLATLIGQLPSAVGRRVIDRTGLTGVYDIDLHWRPSSFEAGPPEPDASAPLDPGLPSIFTAVQEQLGLKLVSSKGPVSYIVIDSAERPTEN